MQDVESDTDEVFIGLERYEIGSIAVHGFWLPVQRIECLRDGSDIWVPPIFSSDTILLL